MSISSVTSAFHIPQGHAQSPLQARRQELQALQHSLNTDDLAGARQAFSALQQNFGSALQAQGGSGAGNQGGNGSPLQNDVAALSRSLQAGDLAGARHNLSALVQDLQGQGQAGLQNRPNTAAGSDRDGDRDGSGSGRGLSLKA